MFMTIPAGIVLIAGLMITGLLAALSCPDGDCALGIEIGIPSIIGASVFVLSWLYLLVVAIWNRFMK